MKPPPGPNVLLYIKAGHRFHFYWDDHPASANALLAQLCDFATDSDLPFTWYDAATVARTLKERNGTA